MRTAHISASRRTPQRVGLPKFARAQSAPVRSSRSIYFTNFRLFDGRSGTLREGLRLLVVGNRIEAVADGSLSFTPDAQAIDDLLKLDDRLLADMGVQRWELRERVDEGRVDL